MGATGIEPVTPSMSTRCLKPNTLSLFGFLKTFVVFFAVCSRRIVAVRCRERVSFSVRQFRALSLYQGRVGGSDRFAKRYRAPGCLGTRQPWLALTMQAIVES